MQHRLFLVRLCPGVVASGLLRLGRLEVRAGGGIVIVTAVEGVGAVRCAEGVGAVPGGHDVGRLGGGRGIAGGDVAG